MLALAPGAVASPDPLAKAIKRDLKFARHQLRRTRSEVPRKLYPEETQLGGRWWTTSSRAWTSGFFPGSLWLMYELTHKREWKEAARRRERPLRREKRDRSTHDLGFMLFDSIGRDYRLTHRRSDRKLLVTAAGALATRYDHQVHAIRSWNTPRSAPRTDFRVIVDGLMNLDLLFWASKHHGHRHGLAKKARQHALTTARNHVRPDGSTYHLVVFNSRTGARKRRTTAQGYSSSSTWARGQAWALYGFTTAYRRTHDPRLLQTARQVALYYMSHLPTDWIPYWDFNAPGIPHAPRDSSAAAIAASALLDLYRADPDPARRPWYLYVARFTLDSLSSKPYLAKGTHERSILLHGTADKPHGRYDHGLIYGDYYFLEAIQRYRKLMRSESAPNR
jgi:unsaturated chondroitin disaccharide hydrolase